MFKLRFIQRSIYCQLFTYKVFRKILHAMILRTHIQIKYIEIQFPAILDSE